MKKVLYLLLFLGMVIIPYSVKADEKDVTGPTLNDYSFEYDYFYSGLPVKLVIDGNDDESEISTVKFTFERIVGPYEIRSFNVDVTVRDNGVHTYTSKKITDVEEGKYQLKTINVYDTNYNNTCYVAWSYTGMYKNENCQNVIKDFEVVVKNQDDLKHSYIESIDVSKTNIERGEEVTFTIKVDDDTADYVLLDYGPTVSSFKLGDNNTFTITDDKSFWSYGYTYKLKSISVYNKSGAQTLYSNDQNEIQKHSAIETIDTIDLSLYNITVANKQDYIPPELKSITMDDRTAYTSGKIKYQINAVDNIPNNIRDIRVYIRKKGTDYTDYNSSYSFSNCIGDDNGFECTMDVFKNMEIGTYYIDTLYITDNSDNSAKYSSTGRADYQVMDYIEFNIDSASNSEEAILTINEEILDKIKNSEDDATISIKSTKNPTIKKEVFDAIKDTNKKLIIEADGIQWIFNGKEIKNETKDIYVQANIYQNQAAEDDNAINSVNSIVINFVDNGLLPGVAMVRIKSDYAFRDFIGTTGLYVYHYDEESGKLDPVAQKIDMASDGYYEFLIEHNSTYIITNSVPDEKYVSDNTKYLLINNEEDNKDNYNVDDSTIVNIDNDELVTKKKKDNNILIIVIVSVVCVLALSSIVFIILKKKKAKKEEVKPIEATEPVETSTDNEEDNSTKE